MADKITESVIKLSADVDEYVADTNRAAKANEALAKSADDYAKTEDKKTKVSRQGRDELQQLEARYNQRLRLEQKLQNEQERMQRLAAKGVGDEAERARVFSLVERNIRGQIDALDKQDVAMRKSSTVTGLARHEMINLSRQIQDVGVSLAGGQSPFRILVEQGSQIADIFASSRATVGDFFRSIGAGIGRLGAGAVFAGIAAGIVAIGAGAVTAALNWGSARNEIEKALLGIGRASGATVDSIEKIAGASSSMFGLSISEAREFAGILASTGRIGVDQIGDLTKMGKNLAITLGVDSTEAAKTLAKALSEPGKGVESLNETLGAFSAGTVRLVQNLVAQNKIMEAQKVIAEGIAEATKNAGEAASTSTQFWTALGNTLSDVWTTIGKIAARTTGVGLKIGVDEAVEQAQKALEAARQQPDIGGMPGIGIGPDPEKIRQAEDALRKATEAQSRWRAEAEATAANIRSLADAKLIRDLSPEIAQMEEIKNRAEGLAVILERTQAAMAAGEFMPGAASEIARAGVSVEQLALSAARAKEAAESMLSPAQKLTAEFELSVKAINARTSSERVAVAAQQTSLQLAGQNVDASEKKVAIERSMTLELARQTAQHKDNMVALQGQLSVAQARTGAGKIQAQYQADINTRLQEGATHEQAAAEAAKRRQIAIENANTAVSEQIHMLRQQNELILARQSGDEAGVKAAQAYENAMRSGADATHAAALEAAVLENELIKVQVAAERGAKSMAQMAAEIKGTQAVATTMGSFGGIPLIPDPVMGLRLNKYTINMINQQLAQRAGLSGRQGLEDPTPWRSDEQAQKIAQQQQDAAQAQQTAAQRQQDAAAAMQNAAAAMQNAAAELIKMRDEAAPEAVATQLLAGLSPQVVNQMIEANQILFGTSSSRFQAQMDLYKRAGMTNEQIAADIRRGVIGEGAKPSELLAALDELTNAVDSNTAAQIGLSDFYTQQGDRLLGYRGFNVQTGIRSPVGASGPGGPVPGAPVTGEMPGAVVNPPLTAPTGGGGAGGFGGGYPGGEPYARWFGDLRMGYFAYGHYEAGQWVEGSRTPTQPFSSASMGIIAAQTNRNALLMMGTSTFAEGGIADRPTLGMFGEAGPEAFVPLRGGKIPVRMSGNDNKPTTVVNINAPLVNFAAEPTRDGVRESAFQAAQMLRRVASG